MKNTNLKAIKTGETITCGNYVIKRISKNYWRLGELMGDWLLGGSFKEMNARIAKIA
jgi:hypothetical protein